MPKREKNSKFSYLVPDFLNENNQDCGKNMEWNVLWVLLVTNQRWFTWWFNSLGVYVSQGRTFEETLNKEISNLYLLVYGTHNIYPMHTH